MREGGALEAQVEVAVRGEDEASQIRHTPSQPFAARRAALPRTSAVSPGLAVQLRNDSAGGEWQSSYRLRWGSSEEQIDNGSVCSAALQDR